MDEQEIEEILYRLDERTKRVDENLDRIDRLARQNRKRMQELNLKVQSNEEDIKRGKGALAIIGTAMSGVLAKIAGLIHL